MKYLFCLVMLVGWASCASAADFTCTAKPNTLVGMSASVVEQAYHLLAVDTAALNVLIARGVVVFVPAGTEFRGDPYSPTFQNSAHIVHVRKQGSPDTLYTKRESLNCHTGSMIDQ